MSSVGVDGSVAGFTVGVGSKPERYSNKANDVGVSYTLANGIKIAALSANGTDADGAKTKASNVGASYTLVPGVKLNAETGKVDHGQQLLLGCNEYVILIDMTYLDYNIKGGACPSLFSLQISPQLALLLR